MSEPHVTCRRTDLRALFLEFLALEGNVKSTMVDGIPFAIDTKIPSEKPTHGPCCTCQTCGRDHDTCICGHNDTLDALDKFLDERVEWDGDAGDVIDEVWGIYWTLRCKHKNKLKFICGCGDHSPEWCKGLPLIGWAWVLYNEGWSVKKDKTVLQCFGCGATEEAMND